ncbi:MAG: YgaP family membrane protein [Cyclobacteriaceae bacterium]
MIKNMGKKEKLVRLMVAAAILIAAFNGLPGGNAGIILMAFAGILTLTSIVGTCPLYLPFKFTTLKK